MNLNECTHASSSPGKRLYLKSAVKWWPMGPGNSKGAEPLCAWSRTNTAESHTSNVTPGMSYCRHPIFSPYAHERMRALKGLARRARVTLASWHASPCSGATTLEAAPVFFAHAFGPCRTKKTHGISGTDLPSARLTKARGSNEHQFRNVLL